MKLVVTGATGNVGTALLARLAQDPAVTAVHAFAVDPPPAGAPFDGADWTVCDLAAEESAPLLRAAAHDAAAVVHLAWDILGIHGRGAQYRTNITGTRRVLSAAAAAGVRRFVHLSSVAVYAPEPSHEFRVAEDWPTTGIPGSWYSADKVAAERLLDHASQAYPWLRVARVRPPAVLQAAAAGELARYVLGPLAAGLRYRWLRPPVVPLPGGLTCQLVHAEDVAELVRLLLHAPDGAGEGAGKNTGESTGEGAGEGAFHVADEPVLSAHALAAAIGVWRAPIPGPALRAGMELSAAAHLQPLNGSWYDMLATAPLVDTGRARRELGWRPVHRADDVLSAVAAQAPQQVAAGNGGAPTGGHRWEPAGSSG